MCLHVKVCSRQGDVIIIHQFIILGFHTGVTLFDVVIIETISAIAALRQYSYEAFPVVVHLFNECSVNSVLLLHFHYNLRFLYTGLKISRFLWCDFLKKSPSLFQTFRR